MASKQITIGIGIPMIVTGFLLQFFGHRLLEMSKKRLNSLEV